MPTYPTDQERVEAHIDAERMRDLAFAGGDPSNPSAILNGLLWLASEVRSQRLEAIAAAAVKDVELVAGQTGRDGGFVPDPPVEVTVPDGDWREIGRAADLALTAGSTAGFPREANAVKITRADGSGECFVTAEAWESYRG